MSGFAAFSQLAGSPIRGTRGSHIPDVRGCIFQIIASTETDWCNIVIESLGFYHFPSTTSSTTPKSANEISTMYLTLLLSIRTTVLPRAPTKWRAQTPVTLKHGKNIQFARLVLERRMPLRRRKRGSGQES